ncbi:MAG: hypothetical protein HYS08_02600 [Chlamydiae bacterium]|nr:hypothetical protein [Chlamydiota bacterium]MBI3266620.1 hypothetical protein [Chlamydiota bacterium]
MKKILFSLLCILGITPFIFAQPSPGLSYRHPDGSFQIQFSAGWVQTQTTSPVQSAYFVFYQGNMPAGEMIVFIEPLMQPVTAQAYAWNAEQNSLRGLQNYQEASEMPISIAGQGAIVRQFSYTQNLKEMTQMIAAEEFYFVFGNAAYTFHFGTHAHLYPQVKPQFDEIIRTLQLFATGPLPPTTAAATTPTLTPHLQSLSENPSPTPPLQTQTPDNTWVPSPQVLPTPEKIFGLKPYQDPKGKFSMQVPDRWLTTESASGLMSVSGKGHVISVEIFPGPETVDVMQSIKTRGKTIVSQGTRVIQGMNGTEIIFKDKDPQGWDVIETLIILKEKNALVSFIAPEAEYESIKSSRDEILKSLRFA